MLGESSIFTNDSNFKIDLNTENLVPNCPLYQPLSNMKSPTILFSLALSSVALAIELQDVKKLAGLAPGIELGDEGGALFSSALEQFYETVNVDKLSKGLAAMTTKAYYSILTDTNVGYLTDPEHPEKYSTWVSEYSKAADSFADDFYKLGFPSIDTSDIVLTGTSTVASTTDDSDESSLATDMTSTTSRATRATSDEDKSSSAPVSRESSTVAGSSSSSTAGGSSVYVAPLGFFVGAIGIALL